MPCAVCERWIEAISRILTLRWRGDVVVGLGAFSGEEVVSFYGFTRESQYVELRVRIASALANQGGERFWRLRGLMTFYKDDQVLGDRTQLGDLDQVLVKVVEQSGWLRWRLCEQRPPPDYIRRWTIYTDLWASHQWYFICDDCQEREPLFQGYGRIDDRGDPVFSDSSWTESDDA